MLFQARLRLRMLFYLAILTIFLIFLEISFFIQCNQAYLSDFSFVADKIHIPFSILPGVFHFIAAQLFVHAMFCLLVWACATLSANTLKLAYQYRLRFGVGVWLLAVLTALTANQYYFPNSKMTELTQIILFTPEFTSIIFNILLVSCSAILILSMIAIVKWVLKKLTFKIVVGFSLLAVVGLLITIYLPITKKTIVDKQPNIIIIGVDSLRPDFIGFFHGPAKTPFIDSFLKSAVVFDHAVTPLARTFPSWVGILTGRYPLEMNVRSNLADQRHLALSDTLPAILRSHGYQTIFATDEARFSNIDKNFGFDQVVAPPMGLNDFLLGTFNDFPLSNLIINTSLGRWLFPYSYANRPVYFTYDPNSFLSLLRSALFQHRDQPLFLAVHFCLPHNPYLWSNIRGNDFDPHSRYLKSISAADNQIKKLMGLLSQADLLDNAIVILLSDHGEALELAGDRVTEKRLFITASGTKKIPHFYPPSLETEEVNQSAGHGTDVLGLSQYRTLLAFKRFDSTQYVPAKKIKQNVSLLDIKPTVLSWLGFAYQQTSGISLLPILLENHTTQLHQHIFLESDFSPAAIRTVYPDTRKVMLEGIELFQVNPLNARLTVKESMAKMIINSKQYADMYGEWMLALYPQDSYTQMPILINLRTGHWTNDLNTSFAKSSPALVMLEALKQFYGTEIKTILKV